MTDRLLLREACLSDAYALWLWANDAESRAAAHGRLEIRWTDHVEWLTSQLASHGVHVWIAELDGGQPVGTIRFDTVDAWENARLSYMVAAESRGRGLGRTLVLAGVERLRALRPRVRVWADTRRDNQRSARVFTRLGWRREEPGPEILRYWLDQS